MSISQTRQEERRSDRFKMCFHQRYEGLAGQLRNIVRSWHPWELTLVADGHIYHAPPLEAEHRISKGTPRRSFLDYPHSETCVPC